MADLKIGDKVTVQIEKMSLHGGGLARHEGFVLFVERSAPGDTLEVVITELKKNHGFAKLHKILTPSDQRKDPPCPYFGKCGGCNWQHLQENHQINWKQKLVHEALLRAWPKPFELLPLVASPSSFRYRNRIQLKKQDHQVGYFVSGTHQLIPIEDCLLAEELLIPAIHELQEKKPKASKTNKDLVENWELSLTEDLRPQIRSLEQRDLAFSQVNREMNAILTTTLLNWASELPFAAFWDLYCGAGNFTFPLLEAFPKAKGTGVELSTEAIEKAQAHCSARGISPKRLEFYCMDVRLFFRRSRPSEDTCVVLDPPRSGLDQEVVSALAKSLCSRIFYVSCDPMSLARDLTRLQNESGTRPWNLVRAQCFDMFPQTDHVETLVELRR